MADEFETFREVSHGLKGLRSEVRLYVAGFAIALGFLAWGMSKGFDKLDNLEASNARMEALMERVATDTTAIKSATKTASLISPDTFGNVEDNFQGVIAPNDTDSAPVFVPAIGNDAPVPAN